jgi:threonyl-tRNA synthetase
VQVDCGREKIGHKIRQHTLNKVPYMAVVGAKETEDLTVNLRHVSGESLGEFTFADAVSYLIKETTPPDLQELAKKPLPTL